MLWVVYSTACVLVLHNAAASNLTSTDARSGKVLFNVVKFPNAPCAGTSALNGTCYTESECTAKGGSTSGACASGFGVCCVFSIGCGSTSSENNTYAVISSYSAASDSDPCIYTFCRANSNICKLRIDFESFISADQKYVAADSVAATAPTHGFQVGCSKDLVRVTNPGGKSPPVICGVNTGQHMWVPASASCNKIDIDIDTGTSTARSWNIVVKQYECTDENVPATDCLQYHTGVTGDFASFGWDTTVNTLSETSHIHLGNQYYSICFRRESGYCAICFEPKIVGPAATVYSSFGVSNSAAATSLQARQGALCDAVAATEIQMDYVEIQNSFDGAATAFTSGSGNKLCGVQFSNTAASIVPTTVCTMTTPFKFGVRFSNAETFTDSAIAAILIARENNPANPAAAPLVGNGYMGFYMKYWQVAC